MSARKGHNPLHETDSIAEGDIGCCGYVLIGLSYLLVIVTFPFSLLWCLKVVQEYERAVIFRLGRIKSSRAQGPGLFFLLPCADNFAKVDLRTFSFNFPHQEVITKDYVPCVVDVVIYTRVFNATKSVVNILNARASTHLLGATTLKAIVRTVCLSEFLSDRERIDYTMKSTLDRVTDNWGVKVERVEIKDIRLPVQMQRAMAVEAKSAREARAKITTVQGKLMASRLLKKAAGVLAETPASLQLRYLQTLQSISEEQNHTVIFPMPANLFSAGVRQMLGRLSGSLAGAQSNQSGQPLIDLQQTPDNTQF
ncbi:stomatin-like isoform X2 [Mercenaria mercenaria]|uniref:stomatin-like isoform X2 n=1 Tax=Mercenaria mercenaria TaxID=6596 RepID=UPI00234EE8B8|nr:stomatin-like isoform X2 [Mercenaria mercenaria]XP_053381104.1 stomatin-like isoform X2 [Mercenaria mercenaria]